jgi:polyvinyl alcohol dehydrogenase (cytochrome)
MRSNRIARIFACGAFAILLTGPVTSIARGEPMWTTYHRDAQHSGYDPDALLPIEPVLAWQTVNLEAPIWSQPLVLGDRVYAATVGNEVYALEASTGEVVWQKSLGTPVPASELPCGDIEPTVGVVGTPVIDPATKVIYMVADTWSALSKEVHHMLEGLSLSTGEEVLSVSVDPPGADPKALLQRTALNLDRGDIVFGYGGNDGDCSVYQGAVAAVPKDHGPPRFWQYKPAPPSISGGAVWAPSGPAVDEAGDVYATTGNPNPPQGQNATVFDYSDSVVELDPARDFVERPAIEAAVPLGWFEPPNWEEESNNDLDLASAGAELLPGGLLFQAGKDGTGYLIDEARLSSGAPAVFKGEVCNGAGSFGGDSFVGGVIYLPCTNGTQALSYDEHACTFTPLWQGPSDAFGPPIVSAGLVWSIATGKFSGGGTKLYGLDPSTGAPRYTETLPSPVVDHFASPSAAGGRLFVATGSTVTAYEIAQLSSGEPIPPEAPSIAGCVSAGGPSETPPSGSTTGGTTGGTTTGPTSSSAVKPPSTSKGALPLTEMSLLHTKLHASRGGRLRLALRCLSASSFCRGAVTLRAKLFVRSRHGVRRGALITLARVHFGPVRGDFFLTLHLNASAEAHLRRHHDRVALLVLLASPGSRTRSVDALLTQTRSPL